MYRYCPICGNGTGRVLRSISMCLPEENHLPASYDVVCCSKCGFTFADVNATQREYDDYYSNCNMYAENNDLKMKEVIRESEYAYAYELISSKVDFDARILDMGCGGGDFLYFLKEKGFKNLCGMDPSKSSIENLKDKGIKGICMGCFDPVSEEHSGYYDVVMSTAVIEHIYDLSNYVLQLTKYMRNDKPSYLFVDAPAVEGFAEHICAVPNYFNHEHINYFSKISLDNLLGTFSLHRVNRDVYIKLGNQEKAVVALCEKKDGQAVLQYDNLSEKSIQTYFEAISIMETELEQKINELLWGSGNIVIWGCGAYAMQVIKQYPMLLEKTECFIDNNTAKQGSWLSGKRIFSSTHIKHMDNVVVAICSMENASDIEKQVKQLAPECPTIIL